MTSKVNTDHNENTLIQLQTIIKNLNDVEESVRRDGVTIDAVNRLLGVLRAVVGCSQNVVTIRKLPSKQFSDESIEALKSLEDTLQRILGNRSGGSYH